MATTEIVKEIQSLAPSALIELFILDFTNLPYKGQLFFHSGSNQVNSDITWQGRVYTPLPIEATGFDINTRGSLPRPRIKVANYDGIFSAEVAQNGDLVGAKIIRKRTFVRYLDAVNFSGGVNPTANPNQCYPDDVWYVEQKISENRYVIEWELSSVFDLQGVMLPYRQVIQNSCPWQYRDANCNYTSANKFTKDDMPTTSESEDVCGKTLESCKVRKDGFPDQILPFGGFPGANRYD